MEAWVGERWHRLVTRWSDPVARDPVRLAQRQRATVTLAQMRQPILMLLHAGGAPQTIRVAPASAQTVGGARSWLQRVAGTGTRADLPALDPQVLALPEQLAVFDDHALNRQLYLWLAALSAALFEVPITGDWLADNLTASAQALQRFAGLRTAVQALVTAQLTQRPAVADLPDTQSQTAEQAVQQGLRAMLALADDAQPASRLDRLDRQPIKVLPSQVAPVWLWLDTDGLPLASALDDLACRSSSEPLQNSFARQPKPGSPDDAADQAAQGKTPQDKRRRKAQRSDAKDAKAPLLMFFRAESLLSWGEQVAVNRANDDDPDDNAVAAADDMDQLAVATGGDRLAARVKFDLDLPSASADDLPLGDGEPLPEWDYRRGQMIDGHCRAQLLQARCIAHGPSADAVNTAQAAPMSAELRSTAQRLRRRMQVLQAAPALARHQLDGDAIDLDAWVRHQIDQGWRGGAAVARRSRPVEAPAVYLRKQNLQRSLATLLLADLSMSTDAYATPSARVIDVIRDALLVFGTALDGGGDPFAMLGFSSVRRQLRVHQLKGFDQRWDAAAQAQVAAIKPGYYTRMGAAIRYATRRLQQRAERQRLLLILTDGKPNDLDVYEGRYGLEDTRQAVLQARQAGLTPFCVTIDQAAHDYLPSLFGQRGYALIHRPQTLVQRLPAIHLQLLGAAA